MRDLAGPTGLARLAFSELRLTAGATLVLAEVASAGPDPQVSARPSDRARPPEWFVYVLAGQGELAAAGERLALQPGDFIGIGAEPACTILNSGSAELVCLFGGEKY